MKKVGNTTDVYSKELESMRRSMLQRKEEEVRSELAELQEKEASNLVQLSLWPEAVRGVPNSILRGSLFAPIQEKYAKNCSRKTLVDNKHFKIVYTGKRLTQTDLDVWEFILHLSRGTNLGEKVYFTERNFLLSLGRSTGKANHEWLKRVFSKLGATMVEITFKENNNYSFEGSLLSNIYRDNTDRFMLVLNPKLHRLFLTGDTWISSEDMQQIDSKKLLAKWLYRYVSTHAKWYPHKVETLMQISGSETKETRYFKKNLIKALEHLTLKNLIIQFHIDEKNHVYIEKPLKKTQQKHLEKK